MATSERVRSLTELDSGAEKKFDDERRRGCVARGIDLALIKVLTCSGLVWMKTQQEGHKAHDERNVFS